MFCIVVFYFVCDCISLISHDCDCVASLVVQVVSFIFLLFEDFIVSVMAVTYSSVDGASNSTIIDVNHQYYLHSSANSGMILITANLNDHNYNQWSRSLKIALSLKMKLRFIDGTYVQPEITSSLYTDTGHYIMILSFFGCWTLYLLIFDEVLCIWTLLSQFGMIWDWDFLNWMFQIFLIFINILYLFNKVRWVSFIQDVN